MSKHTDFILSPITHILNEIVHANSGIGNGIETYPLSEYILQSVFLKMTGFQEQKMKCICWELATNDYEYRYQYTKTGVGEFSAYKDKNGVYQDLIEQIKKYSNFNLANDIDKPTILTTTLSEITDLFLNSNLVIWNQETFIEFEKVISNYQTNHFATDDKTLFAEMANMYSLKKVYDKHLYVHRNRSAHNLQSYQENLPTLKTLLDENYQYHNYFIWFTLLVLIDKVFIELYKKYLIALDDKT